MERDSASRHGDRGSRVKGLIGLVCAVAVGVAVYASATNKVTLPGQDPAARLAQSDSSSDVASYSAALDQLQPKCTQDRGGIAGLADAGQSDLSSHGITETRLDVLHQIASSVPATTQVDCQSVLAAFLLLREGASPTP